MARQPGSANFSGTIEALAGGPLDARSIVKTKADLTAVGSFEYPYIGMETYVVSENKKYRLIGDNPLVVANWEEIGSASIDIDDHIDETSENPVQNKVIAEALDGKADLDEDGKIDASQLRERELHQADYDALTEEEKMNGTTYYIDDSIEEGAATAVCGFTPIGTIISVMGTVAPRNYIACNGQIVNIDTYPELANYFEQQFGSKNKFGGDGVTTFGIPDLRGEFLRGTGTNSHSGNGNGADVGAHQNATQAPTIFVNGGNNPVDIGIQNAPTGYLGIGYPDTMLTTENPSLKGKQQHLNAGEWTSTWIDGKPIYQKMIAITLPTTTDGNLAIATYPLNISGEKYIYLEGYFENSVGSVFNHFNRPINGNLMVNAYINSDVLYIENSAAGVSGRTGHVTFRYTKTTD